MIRIRELRLASNVTQVQLAEMLNVSQPYIHDLENGNRKLNDDIATRIAKALNVNVSELSD